MFQGRFEHSVDDKGRLAIPSAFRRKLGSATESGGTQSDGTCDNESRVVVTISDNCLAAYPLADWEAKLSQISKLNQFDPKVMAFKRIFVGCSQECSLDKAGRILLPPDLRRDAKIEKDCVVIGQIEKFEIWSKERWQASFNQLSDQVGAIYASLADQGIQI